MFEDRAVKQEATEKAQAVVGPDVIFASNTSTLPITSLAETSLKPENFIGIHFFSPVDKMMLVEIIMGEKTGPKALATAIDFVRAIKKTPIVVNDCRGFYANRCVGNYIREGHLMLMEGVPPAMIENCARMAGMPVGPLALNDEVAIDLGWKILQATKKDLGANAVDPAQEKLLEAMVVKEQRLGRKNGKGFYDYPAQRREEPVAGPRRDRRQAARSRHDLGAGPEGPLPVHAVARSGALHGRERRHRPARGGRRLDPRLRLRALHRRRDLADRRRRREGVRRARGGAGGQIRPALPAERGAEGDGGGGETFYGKYAPRRRRDLRASRPRFGCRNRHEGHRKREKSSYTQPASSRRATASSTSCPRRCR